MNPAGLDFYDRLVDELLANDIEPFVTLYHWDLPQALEDPGGWTARETVDAFGEYAQVVAERLGDRVGRWITHNEPQVASWAGYGSGSHAPGRRSKSDATAAAHHLLLSHGRAVEIIRAASPQATVGITLNLYSVQADGDDESAAEVARRIDGGDNRWFLDPIFRGEYPTDVLELLGDAAPPVEEGDLAAISTPLDFLGVNNYSRLVIGGGGKPLRNSNAVYTDMDWEVYPDGLYEVLDAAPRRVLGADDLRDRERRRLRRHPRARRPRFSIPSGRTTSTATSAPWVARCRPASRSAATSSGRSSTTSSGRTATRSASGSSTSTIRRSSGCRREASTGTAT